MLAVHFNYIGHLHSPNHRHGPFLDLGKGQLAPRRTAVVGQILRGAKSAQIEKALKIKPRTVGAHITQISDETGLRSRVKIIRGVFRRYADSVEIGSGVNIEKACRVYGDVLTAYQRDVCDLFTQGYGQAEIAGKLDKTKSAVKAAFSEIYKKFGDDLVPTTGERSDMLLVLLLLVKRERDELSAVFIT